MVRSLTSPWAGLQSVGATLEERLDGVSITFGLPAPQADCLQHPILADLSRRPWPRQAVITTDDASAERRLRGAASGGGLRPQADLGD